MIFQILLTFIYLSFMEWFIHKYLLHNINGFFRFHILNHHKNCAKDMIDIDYQNTYFGSNEFIGAIVFCLIHLPLFFYYKIFYSILILYFFAYFYVHRKCHLDSEWSKKYLPWHYIHHCVNAKKNFGIIHPFFDIILGTYQKM